MGRGAVSRKIDGKPSQVCTVRPVAQRSQRNGQLTCRGSSTPSSAAMTSRPPRPCHRSRWNRGRHDARSGGRSRLDHRRTHSLLRRQARTVARNVRGVAVETSVFAPDDGVDVTRNNVCATPSKAHFPSTTSGGDTGWSRSPVAPTPWVTAIGRSADRRLPGVPRPRHHSGQRVEHQPRRPPYGGRAADRLGRRHRYAGPLRPVVVATRATAGGTRRRTGSNQLCVMSVRGRRDEHLRLALCGVND